MRSVPAPAPPFGAISPRGVALFDLLNEAIARAHCHAQVVAAKWTTDYEVARVHAQLCDHAAQSAEVLARAIRAAGRLSDAGLIAADLAREARRVATVAIGQVAP